MGLLKNKVILVTGAGKGIGKGIATKMAYEGANVIINYAHSKKEAYDVADEVAGCGQEPLVIRADVRDSKEVSAMVEKSLEAFGKIDVLVNNAGVTVRKPLEKTTENDWDKVVDTNLKGAYLCSKAVVGQMINKGSGKIINISSILSKFTLPGLIAYSASKGGLNLLTKAMALELASHQINVNALAPGTIEVERMREREDYDKDERGEGIPWGRVGFPEDIAEAAAFMASGRSDYITGQVFYIDGGISTRMANSKFDPEYI